MKTKKRSFNAVAPAPVVDAQVDQALWAAYRRHDRSRVTAYLLRLYLRLPALVRNRVCRP